MADGEDEADPSRGIAKAIGLVVSGGRSIRTRFDRSSTRSKKRVPSGVMSNVLIEPAFETLAIMRVVFVVKSITQKSCTPGGPCVKQAGPLCIVAATTMRLPSGDQAGGPRAARRSASA